MIPSCAINDPTPYAPGWLGRYCAVMGQDVAPWSFHLLASMLTMSSVIGRRAALVRPAGVLWPPTSILLLGPSGTGKSLALLKAVRVAQAAMADVEAFYVGTGGFTVAGARAEWQRRQRRAHAEVLEGLHVEDEIATIVKERTGTETMTTWLIRCLAHTDLTELLRGEGRIVIPGFTIAFGFGSTIAYLRRSISIDEFTGGLMHRFVIAHEATQRENVDEQTPTDAQVAQLAAELRRIRDDAPATIHVSGDVEKRLLMLRTQARRRSFDSIHLTGYWNRYGMLVLKIASLYVMADGSYDITTEHVDTAVSLLDSKLYPVLESCIDEIAAPREKKRMLEVADSLAAAGPEGWSMEMLYKKMDATNPRAQVDAMQGMLATGLLWQKGQRVYGRKEWAL